MANIHGMGDYNNNNNDNQRAQRQGFMGGGPGGQEGMPDFMRGMFRNMDDMNQDPRKETFLQMLHSTFCPTLNRRSFITMATLAESLVFISVTIISFVDGLNPMVFLGAAPKVLKEMDRNPDKIVHNYQVYRLATAIVVHTGFSHWIMNMITQIIFGSWLEAMVGFNQTALTYVASGVLANVFAAVCAFDQTAVGASTAICGCIAGMLAMIIVNWSVFDAHPAMEQMRCCMVAMCIVMLAMMILMSLGAGDNSDILGHVGGAIFGLLFGIAFYPRPRTDNARKCRMGGLIVFTGTVILLVALLFGLHQHDYSDGY